MQSPHSFDTRGFFFATKCLIVVALILTGVRYGTAYATAQIELGQTSQIASVAEVIEPRVQPEMTVPISPKISIGDRSLPKVSAQAFLVANLMDGTIYAQKNADEVYPMASITKLLTALVATSTLRHEVHITITADDRRQTKGTPGSIMNSDTFAFGELFYPLLMESNNSVAYAFARSLGESAFVARMNEVAHGIGMTNTRVSDSSGISEENSASARDLFTLTKYVAETEPALFAITRIPHKTIVAENGRTYALRNFNHFAENPQFLGGKTGYTDEARKTMTSVFELPVGNATATIAIIVLRTDDRKKDVEKLLAWFKAATEMVP